MENPVENPRENDLGLRNFHICVGLPLGNNHMKYPSDMFWVSPIFFGLETTYWLGCASKLGHSRVRPPNPQFVYSVNSEISWNINV